MIEHLATVPGFTFNGIAAGLKANNKKDLAIIMADEPCPAAAAFTRNKVVAEPVKISKEQMKGGIMQALVVNSKNANACTGTEGAKAVKCEIDKMASVFSIKPEHVFVASTGVIGRPFPTDKVLEGIAKLKGTLGNAGENSEATARAIMTTDTSPKGDAVTYELGGYTHHLAGISKGSGMIHPNMGTMLSFVISDVAVAPDVLSHALRNAVDRSFNMISVDGDTSTNDCVLVMANGKAGNDVIAKAEGEAYEAFEKALTTLCQSLGRQIVDDGEGVTKVLEYEVKGLPKEDDCRQIIRTISTSLLVKTAFFGHDPNWGRLFAAAGRAGVDFDPEKVDLSFVVENDHLELLKAGQPIPLDEEKAEKMLEARNIKVQFDFHQGEASAKGWGTDLSYKYVEINAEYTT